MSTKYPRKKEASADSCTLTCNALEEGRVQLVLKGSVSFCNAADIFSEGEQLLASSGVLLADKSPAMQQSAVVITVNVGQVESIQSVLLSLLLRWLDVISANGHKMVVAGLSEKMLKMTEVTGLDAVLPLQR